MFKKIKLKKILFIIFIYFPLLFCLGEIAFRAYFITSKKDINIYRPTSFFDNKITSDRSRFISHPFLPFFPRPEDTRILRIFKPDINATVTYDYQNNSLGFRTSERPYEKPAGTKRIVTLGGSTTWDGPTNDKTWPALLETKLNDFYSKNNIKIEVINLGMDAGIAQMSLELLDTYGLAYQPDLVLSYDGANDVWFSMYTHKILPDMSNYVKPFDDKIKPIQMYIPKFMFNSYLISFVSHMIDARESYLPNLVWQYSDTHTDKTFETGLPIFERNIRLMRGTCAEFGCAFVASVAHHAKPDLASEGFSDSIRKFYASEQINYTDVQYLLPINDYSIHVDDIHFTEKGLNLMADLWLAKITKEGLLHIASPGADTFSK